MRSVQHQTTKGHITHQVPTHTHTHTQNPHQISSVMLLGPLELLPQDLVPAQLYNKQLQLKCLMGDWFKRGLTCGGHSKMSHQYASTKDGRHYKTHQGLQEKYDLTRMKIQDPWTRIIHTCLKKAFKKRTGISMHCIYTFSPESTHYLY